MGSVVSSLLGLRTVIARPLHRAVEAEAGGVVEWVFGFNERVGGRVAPVNEARQKEAHSRAAAEEGEGVSFGFC